MIKKTIERAYYTNNRKTQINAVLVDEQGVKQTVIINKDPDAEGNAQNPDWLWLHENYNNEELARLTEEAARAIENKQAMETQKAERDKGEILFNMKLEVFEIDEIRNSKNSKLKSKIRRASSPMILQAWTGALLAYEAIISEKPEAKPPTPKKLPIKKKAPAKKKTNLVNNL